GPHFRPARAARGGGRHGFAARPMSRRGVLALIKRYVKVVRPDPDVSAHSPRVTSQERGSDIIDLQDFAGYADPRTTLTYIRNRDRLRTGPGRSRSDGSPYGPLSTWSKTCTCRCTSGRTTTRAGTCSRFAGTTAARISIGCGTRTSSTR